MRSVLSVLSRLADRNMQVSVMPSFSDEWPWLDKMRNLTVQTGLKKLVECETFFVTDLEKLLQTAKIVPDGDVMECLHCLHCVDYAKMPVELRHELARVIAELFSPLQEGPKP